MAYVLVLVALCTYLSYGSGDFRPKLALVCVLGVLGSIGTVLFITIGLCSWFVRKVNPQLAKAWDECSKVAPPHSEILDLDKKRAERAAMSAMWDNFNKQPDILDAILVEP